MTDSTTTDAALTAAEKFRRVSAWHSMARTTEAFRGKTLTFLNLGPREQVEITWEDLRAVGEFANILTTTAASARAKALSESERVCRDMQAENLKNDPGNVVLVSAAAEDGYCASAIAALAAIPGDAPEASS